ncbi:hypothetical protein [Bacillus haynesii]|uniref:hypothetical protein n=1 Tax=Bacillus haynesii TaxID=1925021 RepID=UPI00227EFB45|nr:hypothetical protein [Bacillus haynesii]MCY9372645.1 hypothetical protein [Bacillus haynesii]
MVDLEKAQEYLDFGYSKTKVAALLGSHHNTISRLVNGGKLEIYEAFDENVEPRSKLGSCFYEENYIDDLLRQAAEYPVILSERKDNDYYDVGAYIRNEFGSIKSFLCIKDLEYFLDEIFMKCGCDKLFSLADWYEDKGKLWGLSSVCPSCRGEISYSYVKRNPEKIFNLNQVRRTKVDSLLTKEEYKEVRSRFNWKCAVSNTGHCITLDHFIPVSWGFKCHYSENIIPLTKGLNSSKNNRHPVEWLKSNTSGRIIGRIIRILSGLNNLTQDEFLSFIDWCFDNKDMFVDDPRFPIEIWRESTGREFPLPSYVGMGFSNEVSDEKQAG